MDLEYGIEGTQTIMDRHNSSHEYMDFQRSVLTPSLTSQQHVGYRVLGDSSYRVLCYRENIYG